VDVPSTDVIEHVKKKNVWTGYADRVWEESARLNQDVGFTRWQRGVDRWSKLEWILRGLSWRRAKQSNVAQYCDDGSHKGRIPTGSYNILRQGISWEPKHGQYCQDTYDTLVQGISLGTHGQYRTGWNRRGVETRKLSTQYSIKESTEGQNTDNIMETRTIFCQGIAWGRNTDNIVRKESTQGRNAYVVSQYSVKESTESRNTDNIVDTRTIFCQGIAWGRNTDNIVRMESTDGRNTKGSAQYCDKGISREPKQHNIHFKYTIL